jgi:hypothetical protein
MNTDEQLSQSLLHPEEPVDELAYVPHSHQNARAVVIGWLTTPGHLWFDKHKLWQIKHLMGNL